MLNSDSAQGGSAADSLAAQTQMLTSLHSRLDGLERSLTEIRDILRSERPDKEWYTTAELATLAGKSAYTVREKWCARGRIEAVKDPDTGQWRIPGEEVRRLLNGGGLLPAAR